jgi:hypothetical protein
MAKKLDFNITKALQETVRADKNIKKVYFSEEGEHYFHAHEIDVHAVDEETGHSTGTTKVKALPGVKQSPVKVKTVVNRIPVWKDKMVNKQYQPVAAEFTREEILAAKAVADSKTEAEKLEIIRQAQELMKDDEFVSKLGKLGVSDKK